MLTGTQIFAQTQQGNKAKSDKTKKEVVVKENKNKGMGTRDTINNKTNNTSKSTTVKKTEKKNDGKKQVKTTKKVTK